MEVGWGGGTQSHAGGQGLNIRRQREGPGESQAGTQRAWEDLTSSREFWGPSERFSEVHAFVLLVEGSMESPEIFSELSREQIGETHENQVNSPSSADIFLMESLPHRDRYSSFESKE